MSGAGRAAKNRSWHHRLESRLQNKLVSSGATMQAAVSAGVAMQSRREWMTGSVIFLAAWLVIMPPSGARLRAGQAPAQSEEPVPAYHPQPPTEALPATLDPAQFDSPVVKN